jgi:predicted DNA-binding transcriptional regulator AlpA
MPEHDTTLEVKAEAPPAVINTEYDTPPLGYVPGTVVPTDTAPEDMTDAEYIQWMYDNLTPFWAIKKAMLLRKPPVLEQLVPASAELGSPSFELYVHGDGFVNGESVIVFAGVDEPTFWHSPKLVSTGVNMSVWHEADIVEVSVRTGVHTSAPAQFEFVADEIARKVDRDHDDDDHGKKAKKKK